MNMIEQHDATNTHTHDAHEYDDAIHFDTWHTCSNCDRDCVYFAHVHFKSFYAIAMHVDTRDRAWDTLTDDEFEDDATTMCVVCAREYVRDIDTNDRIDDRTDIDARHMRALRDALRTHDDVYDATYKRDYDAMYAQTRDDVQSHTYAMQCRAHDGRAQ